MQTGHCNLTDHDGAHWRDLATRQAPQVCGIPSRLNLAIISSGRHYIRRQYCNQWSTSTSCYCSAEHPPLIVLVYLAYNISEWLHIVKLLFFSYFTFLVFKYLSMQFILGYLHYNTFLRHTAHTWKSQTAMIVIGQKISLHNVRFCNLSTYTISD